ncbi:MAG: hypothetical protein JWN35_1040 [Frankiales bacterium]|jgi:hypothetical protein|nr:hypothetical protein [Frankiales bacterium]
MRTTFLHPHASSRAGFRVAPADPYAAAFGFHPRGATAGPAGRARARADDPGEPLFPGSDYFERIGSTEVQHLLGPQWTVSDVRLQVAWQLARHGHHADWLAAHFGISPAFARLLVARADVPLRSR